MSLAASVASNECGLLVVSLEREAIHSLMSTPVSVATSSLSFVPLDLSLLLFESLSSRMVVTLNEFCRGFCCDTDWTLRSWDDTIIVHGTFC